MRGLLAALVLVLACTSCAPAVTPNTSPVTTSAPSASQADGVSPPPPTPVVSPLRSPLALVGIQELRSPTARSEPGPDQLKGVPDVVRADAEFGFRLYHLATDENESNFFFSPYSISTALSMALGGARGNTADEMRSVLGLPGDDQEWHEARNRLELALASHEGKTHPYDGDAEPLTLQPTNSIFGQAGYAWRDTYLDSLAANYGAGMQAVDFMNAPEPARLAINDWVSERTHERIPELLGQGAVNRLTRAALVNAIYFKGNWYSEFSPENTSPEPFRLLDGSTVDVETMHGSPEAGYAAGKDWAAVNLHYWGSASMTVIVPDPGSFEDIERKMDADFIAQLDKELSGYRVHLALPRWETDSRIEQLVPQLQQLGMVDVFDRDVADLSGMADFSATHERLYVTRVVHQANISVDEEGTEAAAATAVLVGIVCKCPPPEVTLTVDRPFIYLIRDDITGEILFIGRLLDPIA